MAFLPLLIGVTFEFTAHTPKSAAPMSLLEPLPESLDEIPVSTPETTVATSCPSFSHS